MKGWSGNFPAFLCAVIESQRIFSNLSRERDRFHPLMRFLGPDKLMEGQAKAIVIIY